MILDGFVEERLGDGGIVHFAVAVTPVADHIDHNVAAEGVAVLERDATDTYDGVYVFSVNVENGNGLSARELRGKPRRVQLVPTRGEAQQVIDNHVHSTADSVALEIGEVKSLRSDALSGESSVAMHQKRQVLLCAACAHAVLLGAGSSDGYGVNRLEMAGVRNQVDVNSCAAAGDVIASGAHMVFHIATPQHTPRVYIFETCEHFLGGTPGDVHYHIQSPAVAHAHHQFNRSMLASTLENFVDKGKQGCHALQRKALGTEITLL